MRNNPRRANNFICAIDVAALASVMFVLMFLMMYNGALVIAPHHGVSVDLPRVGNPVLLPNEGREDAMQVAVTRQGDVFFNRDLMTGTDRLPGLMREQVRLGSQRKVYVRADARARYRTVKDVIDAVHYAGIEQIAFIADQRRDIQQR